MLPRLSQRTYDLLRRAIDALDKDTADLITTRVASAFVDGGKEALARNHEADGGGEGGHVAKLPPVSVPQSDHPRVT
jgi:hypothetical protein